MSRVQCLECGIAVVVDPTGVCPEGHLVGSAGVRVAGAMGSHVPHPDEPEPWVATVVLDEVDASPVARERTIRPLQVTGADAATEAERGDDADHESVLRELHALGDDGGTAPASAAPETAPVAEASPPAHVPPPPQQQVAEGFAELAALEAAFHALGFDEDVTLGGDQPDAPSASATTAPSPPTDGPSPTTQAHAETGPSEGLEDVEGLFAPPAPSSPSPSAPPAASTPPLPGTPDADPPDGATPSAAAAPEEVQPGDADEAPRAKGAGLDIANFTARGSKVGSGRGGRRRLFGR